MTNFRGVFFTGDRMMTQLYPGLVAVELLRALGRGQEVWTGTADGGIEQLVRMIMEEAGADLHVIAETDTEFLYESLPEDIEVLSIHMDHQSSAETKLALALLPDDQVRLITALDVAL